MRDKSSKRVGAAEALSAPPPRERIVATANDLFHRHGLRGVGVETIAEAAGTNKMTLYRHFESKDELILEYLNYKGKKSEELWADIERASAPAILPDSFTPSSNVRPLHRRG